MSKKDQIFVSYSHEFEKETGLVQKIEDYCHEINAPFELIREKERVKTRDSFGEYMRAIGRGWLVLVVLSDEYFRSENCLYELQQIHKNQGVREKRIFPILLDGYKCDAAKAIELYLKYWEDKPAKFDKHRLTEKLIRETCEAKGQNYESSDKDFHKLVSDITDFFEKKRQKEKEDRKDELVQLRKQYITEIQEQLDYCKDLKKSIKPNAERFMGALSVLSEASLQTSLMSLHTASDAVLKLPRLKYEIATKLEVCNTAIQIFNRILLLSFDEQHFINKPVAFNGEIRLFYEVSVDTLIVVEGYMSNEYGISADLTETEGKVHGRTDLSRATGLQNGWLGDQQEEDYKAIHSAVGVSGEFENTKDCYKKISDYIQYLRNAKTENFYISKKGFTGDDQRLADQLHNDIPALAIINYGIKCNDQILILNEQQVEFPIHAFFKLIREHQTYASTQQN